MKRFKKLASSAIDSAVETAVETGVESAVEGLKEGLVEGTALEDLGEIVGDAVEDAVTEAATEVAQQAAQEVVDELKDRLGITEEGEDDDGGENEEEEAQVNGDGSGSESGSEVVEDLPILGAIRRQVEDDNKSTNTTMMYWQEQAQEARETAQEAREEILEEVKEEIAEQIKEEILERVKDEVEDFVEDLADAVEDMSATEVYKANAPPPQPMPRATLEERTVNLNYWKQQSQEEDQLRSAAAAAIIPEVIEHLVEDAKDSDTETVVTVTDQREVLVNEKNLSNAEVLQKMIAEGEVEEEDMPNIQQLLAAAKMTRKPKTETFIIRSKKRQESIKRAVDYNAVAIVIEDKNAKPRAEGPGGAKTIRSGGRTFEVSKEATNAFTVRKASVIQPASETVVTKKWIENAISTYEQEKQVEIIQMNFETKSAAPGQAKYYEARVSAKVGEQNATKDYSWIIKAAPKSGTEVDPSDKDTYIVSDLGSKIAAFVAGKKLRRGGMTLPFQPVIFADSRYAIFDDVSAHKSASGFLTMDQSKQALRSLAKLHAMSYAYFHQGSDDVKGFSEVLKMIVLANFQPTARPEGRKGATDFLGKLFENALSILRSNGEEILAEKASKKFGDRLYPIYKDALASSSPFSVLCHGNPMPENFSFQYDGDRPMDVRMTGFQRSRYAHAATDLQQFFAAAVGDRVDDQTEFLVRFVYFESLSANLRALGVADAVDFDSFRKSFRKLQVFGCLTGAMLLGEKISPPRGGAPAPAPQRSNSTNGAPAPSYGTPLRRATGKRVFESKIAGKFGSGPAQPAPVKASSSSPAARPELSGPVGRIKELLERALTY